MGENIRTGRATSNGDGMTNVTVLGADHIAVAGADRPDPR
jgi:hypothetical protein